MLECHEASAAVLLKEPELLILVNALNETLEALEDWEIPIRVGARVEEIEKLNQSIREILGELRRR